MASVRKKLPPHTRSMLVAPPGVKRSLRVWSEGGVIYVNGLPDHAGTMSGSIRALLEPVAVDVLYHLSPRKNRESIAAQGLLPHRPRLAGGNETGVYAFSDLGIAIESGRQIGEYEVWQIDARGLTLYRDGRIQDRYTFVSLVPIARDRLQLLPKQS